MIINYPTPGFIKLNNDQYVWCRREPLGSVFVPVDEQYKQMRVWPHWCPEVVHGRDDELGKRYYKWIQYPHAIDEPNVYDESCNAFGIIYMDGVVWSGFGMEADETQVPPSVYARVEHGMILTCPVGYRNTLVGFKILSDDGITIRAQRETYCPPAPKPQYIRHGELINTFQPSAWMNSPTLSFYDAPFWGPPPFPRFEYPRPTFNARLVELKADNRLYYDEEVIGSFKISVPYMYFYDFLFSHPLCDDIIDSLGIQFGAAAMSVAVHSTHVPDGFNWGIDPSVVAWANIISEQRAAAPLFSGHPMCGQQIIIGRWLPSGVGFRNKLMITNTISPNLPFTRKKNAAIFHTIPDEYPYELIQVVCCDLEFDHIGYYARSWPEYEKLKAWKFTAMHLTNVSGTIAAARAAQNLFFDDPNDSNFGLIVVLEGRKYYHSPTKQRDFAPHHNVIDAFSDVGRFRRSPECNLFEQPTSYIFKNSNESRGDCTAVLVDASTFIEAKSHGFVVPGPYDLTPYVRQNLSCGRPLPFYHGRLLMIKGKKDFQFYSHEPWTRFLITSIK